MNRLTRPLLAMGLILSLTALADPAATQQSVKLNITTQPMEQALQTFAKQSGLQVIFPTRLARDLTAPQVEGSFTPAAALEILLRDSGLDYRFVNARTVSIRVLQATSDLNRNAADDSSSAQRLARAGAPSDPSQTDGAAQDGQALPAAEQDKSGKGVSEIVVTAQKRQERLQDVPISISVLGGKDLDKSTVQGISEALNRVPGVATTISALGNPQIVIRGVTSNGLIGDGSTTTAYYLDSVPFGFVRTALVPDSNAYDLERVEVLRGPQGTLYGSSALNGVVRILTKDADLNRFELKTRASLSSTKGGGENYRGDMALNVPLVENKLAARAVIGYQDLSGWIEKPNRENANDGELKNMRLKINAQPTDALSVVLSTWLSRTDFGSQSIADINQRSTAAREEAFSADYDAYGLKLGYDFSGFSLSSATSYLDYAIASGLDYGPFGFPLQQASNFDSKVFAQEVNLNSSQQGNWRWSVGGIYRDVEDRTRQRYTAFLVPQDRVDTSQSFAVYGEATRLFQDGRLELTAGLRHFVDDVTDREQLSFTGNPATPLVRTNGKFNATTPRVVLTWHTGAESTVYASYSEGFRSGFTQLPSALAAAPQFEPLDADSLKNYEIGTKGSAWGGRLGFDAAVYYIDWQDVQQALSVVVGGFPVGVNLNSESASGVGFEFALTTEPAQGLQLRASFSWNDLKMDADVLSGGFVLFNKGDRLNMSPELTAGASADYEFPVGGGGFTGRLSASANYVSEQDSRRLSGPLQVIGPGDPMLIGRTSFAVDSPNHWQTTFYIDNVNNERGTPVIPPFGVAEWAARVRPRTFGAQVEYSFQ